MSRNLFIFIVLLSFMLSCSKEVEVDQPPYTPKVVVDGYIEQDGPAMVFLTLSSPFLTHYDSASIVKTFLNYAKVEIVSSEGETEVLTLFKYNKFFPPFVYRSTELLGKVGVEYQLKVTVKGRIVEAVTSIPEVPNIKAVRYTSKDDTTGYLEFLSVLNPAKEQNLFIQIRSLKADKNFHPSANPIYTLPQGYNNDYWHRAWRSKESTTYMMEEPDHVYIAGFPRYVFHKTDTVWLKVGCVDSISSAVLKSMFIDLRQNENPFAFNGNRVITNIEGGIGRWTGIGVAPIQWICGETKLTTQE